MTPEMWVAAIAGALAGVLVTFVALHRRTKREVIARTLVPHRTRQVLASLQSGAVIVRRDRRAAFANHAAVTLGVARPDGALDGGVADLAERAWERDDVVEADLDIQRRFGGATVTIHVRATPVDQELVLAVANDNSEARAAELNRREFAANVSHELKTPVGALSLLAESIEAGADDPPMVREFAAKIRRESRRLTKLIQEIIEISRLQGGDYAMDMERFDVADAVQEAIDNARVAAEAKRITLLANITDRPVVMGDPDLVTMAVGNLIDNAVNYSDSGTRVTVTCARDKDLASITVIDQGLGIEARDIERVFERFYRADPARARDTGGTGLGLSIVKHVARQHGGAVDVWSQPRVGSTFTLRIPVYQEEQ